ncbi:MAG: hypothetical protein CMI54_01735 [Parcubacteria group bacterium]|nr:hypothetical protein [Parcubacteria group bacterium]|tara:strand:- start:11228 stop:12475 length:1248 start_codon:yes stop_codon:yes gene_type:complete
MALDNTELKVIDMITKDTIMEMRNNFVILDSVNRNWEGEFGKSGAQIGDTVRVRRPVYVESSDGAVVSSFDEIEQGSLPLIINRRKKVALKITRNDLTLGLDSLRESFSNPAAMELGQAIESDIGSLAYKETYNFTGTPGTEPSTFDDISETSTRLTELGTPITTTKMGIYNSRAARSLASGLQLVNPQKIATTAIEEASVGRYAKVNIMESNSLPTHTVGALGGTPLVNGASQNVTYAASSETNTQTLNVDGWTVSVADILKEGDVFTIVGVNSVNRRTRVDTGILQDFVVRADATSNGSGETALTISPAIITSGPYQTVTAAPADNAALTIRTGTAATGYKQNLVFVKEAISLAMVPLAMPFGGVGASQQTFEGVTIKVVTDFDITNDINQIRWDIMYGVKVVAQDMIVRHTS